MIPNSEARLLIDAGPSEVGWSFWSPFFLCMQKGYRTYIDSNQTKRRNKRAKRRGPLDKGPGKAATRRAMRLPAEERDIRPPSDAMVRGSMGHAALAHRYARMAAAKGSVWFDDNWIDDPELFLDPEEAIQAWTIKNGVGHKFISEMQVTYLKYAAKDRDFSQEIVGVEIPIRLELGWNSNHKWGLWLKHPWVKNGVTRPNAMLNKADLLDCEELVEPRRGAKSLAHGKPIVLTKRFDLVVRDSNGLYYIWDHKFTGMRVTRSKVDQYYMDGQFAVNHIAGDLLFGDQFGGMLLNFVQRRPPYTIGRYMVPRTPFRDRAFPYQLKEKAYQIASLLSRGACAEEWSLAQSELACYHRYGPCQAMQLCKGE